jgi:hypothetical protein
VTALLVAACGSTTPSPSPSTLLASAEASSPIVPPASLVAPSPPATPQGSVAPVAADPTLLDVLKASQAKLNLTYDPDTTASVLTDPSVARDLSALAIGLGTPAGKASPQEFVIANVARLRDPSKDEGWFRSWRDTYDQAACEQAGGLRGNAETDMGGTTVFIGSCQNGATTYHARLQDGSVVVSLTSVGPSHLGEELLRATLGAVGS